MDPKPLTVTQLNRQVRFFLESELGAVTVQGELSNLSKPSSGHYYFTLKDSGAQLRCVYFRNHHRPTPSDFYQEGEELIAKGKLSLYEARGDYQLIVHELSPAGLGELYQQFELLKKKLQNLGLFEASKKKTLPRFPRTIGIVTSVSAAALQDILTTLGRRYPLAAVKVYNSEVQGKSASLQLIRAIQKANQDANCDVLILARGGGSIEDLWAFNDEELAFTIHHSLIPIVSGIGHEIDFTIADFVADLRAPTPTAAAEAVTPNHLELMNYLRALERQLIVAITRIIQHQQLRLNHKMAKILSPKEMITRYWQSLDYFSMQLQQCIKNYLCHQDNNLRIKNLRLNAKNPQDALRNFKIKLQYYEKQLSLNMFKILQNLRENFSKTFATLQAVSPLATLKRGYAIVSFKEGLLCDSNQINLGEEVSIQLAQGKLTCEVLSKEK